MVKHLESENEFNELIKGRVLVDFYADWCGPCKRLAPLLEELEDINIIKVNVDMFGKYLSEEKSRSQFIVITHKKRMMEYADSLYGITMQESGVSKIVSAKLEN